MLYNIAIITGGYSSERKIALKSAQNVFNNIDKNLFKPWLIELKEDGKFYYFHNNETYIVDKNDFKLNIDNTTITFDCVIILIHGTPGEDGKLQGYLDILKIPYTTSGTLESAMTFNKYVCQNYASFWGINTAKSVLVRKTDIYNLEQLIDITGLPCFVKPNNGGSSINTSKVTEKGELKKAIDLAFSEDNEIIISEFIDGIELTCGVLQKENDIVALPVTEIVPKNAFFDFEAKYDMQKCDEITPARISEKDFKKCQEISVYLFKKFNLRGIARFDYILRSNNNEFYFLEVNTIPGMTEASIIPKQAQLMNISIKELITIMINNVLKK